MKTTAVQPKGLAVGETVTVGLGAVVAVWVGLEVGDAVTVGLGAVVAVWVGLAVGVGVGLEVGVGVIVGRGLCLAGLDQAGLVTCTSAADAGRARHTPTPSTAIKMAAAGQAIDLEVA